ILRIIAELAKMPLVHNRGTSRPRATFAFRVVQKYTFWCSLVSKYADHLPLYRQYAIYERQGIELERSTLADWVGGTSALLEPLGEVLRRYVMAASKLHADDTRVPVLAPGTGKTKTGRLWTYVRDDRPAGDPAAPAVWFA